MIKKEQIFRQKSYLFFNIILFQLDTSSNNLSTFRCLICNMLCQGLQNSHRFPIWPFHLMEIFVPGAISLSLGTDKKTVKTLQLWFCGEIWNIRFTICGTSSPSRLTIGWSETRILLCHFYQWPILTVKTFRTWWTPALPSMTGIRCFSNFYRMKNKIIVFIPTPSNSNLIK